MTSSNYSTNQLLSVEIHFHTKNRHFTTFLKLKISIIYQSNYFKFYFYKVFIVIIDIFNISIFSEIYIIEIYRIELNYQKSYLIFAYFTNKFKNFENT